MGDLKQKIETSRSNENVNRTWRHLPVLHAAAICALSLATATPTTAGVAGTINIIAAQRSLRDSAWDPGQDVFDGGGEISFGGRRWPIRFDVGFFTGQSGRTVKTGDASFGLVFGNFANYKFRVYAGGGVSQVDVELTDSTLGLKGDKDKATGTYVRGGFYGIIKEFFSIGIDVRVGSGADFQFGTNKVSADYTQVGLMLGVNFKE